MSNLNFEESFIQIIDAKSSPTEQQRHGINPANLKPNWEVPVATIADVDRAVSVAKEAFKAWSKVPQDHRRSAVVAYANAVEKYKCQFSDLLVSEQGKPVRPAQTFVLRGFSCIDEIKIPQADAETHFAVRWMREMADITLPEDIIEDNEHRKVITRYTPIGVVAALVPWNFPLLLAAGKIAPALLAGNVIIVKPSPFTPYCGLKLVELAQQFFPPGVVQSLSGDDHLGPWITSHPGIDKISFTGSTNTGKAVMRSASQTLKRITLELGGNDPAIIFPDINIDKVAQQIAFYAFLNSGQICLNLKRIYVHESIFNDFREALVKHVKSYKLGDGSEKGTTHGPLQNSMQFARVKTFFDDIQTEGWKVAVGGSIQESHGYFVNPTIIDSPPDDSRIVVEEPFGPIVPILPWGNEEDVIARANDTVLGLGASVWTNDLKKAERVARQIQAGSVWINNHFDISPLAPFGGHKESGIGTEWGLNGLKGFCNVQTLFLNKNVVN